jgi:dCTP deaminase
MAILTGPEIIRQIGLGSIKIDPFEEKNVGPNSVNLCLADKLLVYKGGKQDWWASHIAFPAYADEQNPWDLAPDSPKCDPYGYDVHSPLDMRKDNPVDELAIPPSGIVLFPGMLYLGSTLEYTETHGFAPCIEGRSSIGRLGITTHQTAGFGDCGYCGRWTTEISVVHPVRIYAGVGFVQIVYHTIEGTPRPYAGKYQGDRQPRPSAIWKELQ